MNIQWDAEKYTSNFSFVHKYGNSVTELIEAPEGSRVLDLGCGNGALTGVLKDQGFQVIGLDDSKDLLSVAKKYGQQPIYWSIDTNDWRKYSTETMVNTILNNLSDGAVILMHEGKSNTLDALPAIAEAVRAAGYEFVPLSELLSY